MKKIDLMHAMFGKAEGECAECRHFEKHWRNVKYFKCRVYGVSASEATDWRKKYPACGLKNIPTSYRDVYKSARSDKKAEVAEGQMSLF